MVTRRRPAGCPEGGQFAPNPVPDTGPDPAGLSLRNGSGSVLTRIANLSVNVRWSNVPGGGRWTGLVAPAAGPLAGMECMAVLTPPRRASRRGSWECLITIQRSGTAPVALIVGPVDGPAPRGDWPWRSHDDARAALAELLYGADAGLGYVLLSEMSGPHPPTRWRPISGIADDPRLAQFSPSSRLAADAAYS